MKVSEGWARTFVVLSVVYWLLALFVSGAAAVVAMGEPYKTPWPVVLVLYLIVSALIYGGVAGLVAGVVWIIAGFRKSKPADE